MLEKPDLDDQDIIDCLRDSYALPVTQVTFLPLGADSNTAVYRAVSDDGTPYFVKLRRGYFDETTVLIPALLHDQGVTQIIAPLPTQTRQLWARLGDFTVTLSPFVAGHNGYEVNLSDRHWVELGRVLKQIHLLVMPPALRERIPREAYSAHWRDLVRGFQAQVADTRFGEPIAAALAVFLHDKRAVVSELVSRAERLAQVLRTRDLEYVLCHADIHAGNGLIDAAGRLYVVDWDTLMLAPKERDLMFVGGGLWANHRTPEQEETLFYQGYGPTDIDPIALAYYRDERIVQDIAAYCQQILSTEHGGQDREEGLRQFTSQFLPGQVVEIAFRSERQMPDAARRAKDRDGG